MVVVLWLCVGDTLPADFDLLLSGDWIVINDHFNSHTRVQTGRWERLTYFGPGELREVNFDALVPLEIDDEYILRDRVLDPHLPPSTAAAPAAPTKGQPAPPPAPFTLASAFIIHSRVFLKGLRESMATTGCECELRRTPSARLARLRELLMEMRYMLDDAPGPVRQWAPPAAEREEGPAPPTTPDDNHAGGGSGGVVSGFGSPVVERRHGAAEELEAGMGAPCSRVVQGQLEIMRANIHVTHLWLQSLLLEQVDVVVQEEVIGGGGGAAGGGAAGAGEEVSASLKANWAEREDICRQMLHLLHSIPYVYLEPNGLYLVRRFIFYDCRHAWNACGRVQVYHWRSRADTLPTRLTRSATWP